jgi:hypothetical protein
VSAWIDSAAYFGLGGGWRAVTAWIDVAACLRGAPAAGVNVAAYLSEEAPEVAEEVQLTGLKGSRWAGALRACGGGGPGHGN